MLMISVSENFLAESELLFYNVRLVVAKTRYLYLRWSFFFNEIQLVYLS
jgi:hypothetical protein